MRGGSSIGPEGLDSGRKYARLRHRVGPRWH